MLLWQDTKLLKLWGLAGSRFSIKVRFHTLLPFVKLTYSITMICKGDGCEPGWGRYQLPLSTVWREISHEANKLH